MFGHPLVGMALTLPEVRGYGQAQTHVHIDKRTPTQPRRVPGPGKAGVSLPPLPVCGNVLDHVGTNILAGLGHSHALAVFTLLAYSSHHADALLSSRGCE